MKAAVLTHYDKNGTDLEIREVSVPVPEVDEIFRLDQINEAMAKVKHGKSKGKTIIIMEK